MCALSGWAYMNYYKLVKANEKLAQLKEKGQLDAFLKELNQQMAFTLDDTLNQYEKGTKIADYRQVLVDYCQGKVLETCVGTSRNGKYYEAGLDITFLDWSANMIEMALTKSYPFIKSTFVIQDVRKMQFNDDSFDTVIDTFGLEAVEKPQLALKEMRRVCKPGGRILLLAHGLPTVIQTHKIYHLRAGKEMLNGGSRGDYNWKQIIDAQGLEIERQERKVNGTIYFYVLKNNKTPKSQQTQRL